jgi:hypothetical protein
VGRVGVLFYRDSQAENFDDAVCDGVCYSWADGVERRVGRDDGCGGWAGEWGDDTCALEYVDCEQCGDECRV